jgi:serine/threonine-protein kinase HipA
LDDFAYNEHFCLLLARELGLTAARSSVQTFGGEVVIVVERYDRERINGVLTRVHQEDLCQALGIPPTRKYESEGGPGVAAIAGLLQAYSTDPDADRLRFLDAMALNWLLAATDGHAKNYSILHAGGPQLRLAPLYDVITVLPYPQLNKGRRTLAMSIGGTRVVDTINGAHWTRLAREIGTNTSDTIERVSSLAMRIPDAIRALLGGTYDDKYTKGVIERLGEAVVTHSRVCLGRL